MLGSIGQREMGQVWQGVEDVGDVESLELSDHQSEDLVACRLQLLLHLLQTALRFEIL